MSMGTLTICVPSVNRKRYVHETALFAVRAALSGSVLNESSDIVLQHYLLCFRGVYVSVIEAGGLCHRIVGD
jgi:hypothetical protein